MHSERKVAPLSLPAQRQFPLVGTHAVRVADPKPIVSRLASVQDHIAAHSEERLLNPHDDLPDVPVAASVAALRPNLAKLALPYLCVVAVVCAPVPVPILCRFHFDLIVVGNSAIGIDGCGKNVRLLVEPFMDDALGFGRIVRFLELVDRVQHGLGIIRALQCNRREGILADRRVVICDYPLGLALRGVLILLGHVAERRRSTVIAILPQHLPCERKNENRRQ